MLSRLLKADRKKLGSFSPCLIDVLPIVFIVLLLLCAPLLIQGNFELGNYVALGAYFILGSAPVLQIISFIRRKRIDGRERND
jgi:hypothetical protein